MVVCPLHWYFDPDHLEHVIDRMTTLGPPVLRGFFDVEEECYLLREGTHRIRAAHLLGLTPTILIIPWWRSKASLERARFAAKQRGLWFGDVHLEGHIA